MVTGISPVVLDKRVSQVCDTDMTHTRTAFAAALIAIPAALTACSSPAHTTAQPAACTSPSAPSGTTVSVDAQGNASAPYTGGIGLKCTDGSWVRLH